MANITFTDTIGVPNAYYPKPATSSIPNWYKDMHSYTTDKEEKKPNGQGSTSGTLKRCMPVFDAMVGGYIIYTYADVYISQIKQEYGNREVFEKTGKMEPLSEEEITKQNLPRTTPSYEWPSYSPLGFHDVIQAPTYPERKNLQGAYPKWINPWAIKTPPGYSVLFTQPMHRESVFTILPGVVDTDQYDAPVNFPFVLKDWGFTGLIPAGTPMAQVIPFKRESWQMDIGTDNHKEEQLKTTKLLRTRFFDSYKTEFRQPKEYR